MSRGTQHLPLRIDPETLARIDAEVAKQNLTRADAPYTRSTWIRLAIRERLAKLERGRRPAGPAEQAG